MDQLLDAIQYVLNLGAAVMLPIMIVLIGLVFRMKIGQALKSGLMVGIGFQGLVLTISLLTTAIGPVIGYYQGMGSGFTTVDIGFAAVGAASWTVPFAPIAVLAIVGINLLLLKLNLIKVMNVDIWNFIHFLIPGAMVYAIWGSFWIGLITTVVISIVTLYLSQWIAPKWGEHYGLEGTTCTCFSFIALTYPIAWALNKVMDHIPGINKVNVDMNKIQQRLGFFGDPAIIGLIIGIFLGVLTQQEVGVCLQVGVGLAAVLILIPRMVGIMMEGLSAVGNAATAQMRKKMGEDKELYIGMDVAIGLGDPTCITTTVLVIPIIVLFAFIIPNMSYFPVSVLGAICYVAPLAVLASKGNFMRSMVTMIVCSFLIIYCMNAFAPEATKMMLATGVNDLPSSQITDISFGINPACILVAMVSRIF